MFDYLNDLPTYNKASKAEIAAVEAFKNAINSTDLFEIQREDEHDYGTDIQLELKNHGLMTNIRIHVQIKGTEKKENIDNSISISVDRANTNYLYKQRNSIYICYHLCSKRLLVRFVDDVIREYEHKSKDWHFQKKITITFYQLFDCDFQRQLHQKVLSQNKNISFQHHKWNIVEPKEVNKLLIESVPYIAIPDNYNQAQELLSHLYNKGQDYIISAYFDEFFSILGKSKKAIQYAYMSEINLGINGMPINEKRVRDGIELLNKLKDKKIKHQGNILYCIANGWNAINEFELAKSSYLLALKGLRELEDKPIRAMCYKNLGSIYEKLNETILSRDAYESALKFDPYLKEAHFALGLWHYKYDNDLDLALKYLDSVKGFAGNQQAAVHGWKMAIFFELEDNINAFREVSTLLGQLDDNEWIFPWCASYISKYGKKNIESARKSAEFWYYHLSLNPSHIDAEIEYLLCQAFIKLERQSPDIFYAEFKARMLTILNSSTDEEQAFIWDRIGHWAQVENQWEEAEECFRNACKLKPNYHYEYCLGTVLNHLKRYKESLPLLLLQAQEYQPDAYSWYQVSEAYHGLNDIDNTIIALQKTVELDPAFEIAWVNLNGILLNSGEWLKAKHTLDTAIELFPKNETLKMMKKNHM